MGNSSFFKKINLDAPIIEIDDDPVKEPISELQEQNVKVKQNADTQCGIQDAHRTI